MIEMSRELNRLTDEYETMKAAYQAKEAERKTRFEEFDREQRQI